MNTEIIKQISENLQITEKQVQVTLSLLEEGKRRKEDVDGWKKSQLMHPKATTYM